MYTQKFVYEHKFQYNFPGIKILLFPITQKRPVSLLIFFLFTWQRPTLTGGNPQLPSALKSLTSVFGMGTGVASSPSSPDNLFS